MLDVFDKTSLNDGKLPEITVYIISKYTYENRQKHARTHTHKDTHLCLCVCVYCKGLLLLVINFDFFSAGILINKSLDPYTHISVQSIYLKEKPCANIFPSNLLKILLLKFLLCLCTLISARCQHCSLKLTSTLERNAQGHIFSYFFFFLFTSTIARFFLSFFFPVSVCEDEIV